MTWTIRPFTPEDLGGIVKAQNACASMHKVTLAEIERDIQTLSPELQRMMYVALARERVIGYCSASRVAGAYHPNKFFIELGVLPRWRKRGIGTALYDAMVSNLASIGLESMSAQVSERDPVSLKFAADRGYAEQKRDFVSELMVKGFDATAFQEYKGQAEIRSFSELDSPEFRREWYDLFCIVRQDVPRSAPPTPLSFEFFEEQIVNEPDLAKTATVFALVDGRCVGFSGSFLSATPKALDQWLTAVHRDFRGQGIALALKLRQIEAAKVLGVTKIITDNDSRNAAMLAINGKLGFVRQPAVLSMRKDF